jgi:hypothetical protein
VTGKDVTSFTILTKKLGNDIKLRKGWDLS